MLRLRGHHLLCLLTFVGEGYTPAFTQNFRLIAARVSAGEEIEIVEGPDDICAPMLGSPEAHCSNRNIRDRDEWALTAIAEQLGVSVKAGSVLKLDRVRLDALRGAFAAGLIRAACDECEWSGLCTRIARDGFDRTLVQAECAAPAAKRL